MSPHFITEYGQIDLLRRNGQHNHVRIHTKHTMGRCRIVIVDRLQVPNEIENFVSALSGYITAIQNDLAILP